jgi:hypothetical protein
MAVFCDYGNGLHAPDFANCEPELPKVSSHTPKYSRFFGDWRWRPGSIANA